jgi:hypothetical protein
MELKACLTLFKAHRQRRNSLRRCRHSQRAA